MFGAKRLKTFIGENMKKTLLMLLMLVSTSVLADGLSGNAGMVSDYRFRGMSQTQNSRAIQGGVEYGMKGFYVGNWNSSVSTELYTNGSGLESDIYGGYKLEVVKGVTVDVGSYNYFYQRAATATNKKYDTNELYAGLTAGPIGVKYTRSISDYFGVANSVGSQYFQADANVPVPGIANVTLNGHVGRTKVNSHDALNYTDYKLGATYSLKGWDLGAHYYTNKAMGSGVVAANTVDGQHLYKNAVVLSVAKAF
jgi:uncharacterized protein (TIGR02001 family)